LCDVIHTLPLKIHNIFLYFCVVLLCVCTLWVPCCYASPYKWCSVRLYLQLFVRELMSYLRYLCLFAHSSVQHILCYVFVLLVFVLCVLCCQLLWIVHLRLSLRYSLTLYVLLEQAFRLFIILITVILRRKYQWYIVSQLLLEQNIWQVWSLVLYPTQRSFLLKIIFFIRLKTTKIILKIQISDVCDLYWSCDIQFHKYAVHINGVIWW
jgi:hypothetical protein